MKFIHAKKIVTACLAVVMAAALTACGGSGSGSNPTIDGIDGPHVEFTNGMIMLSMVFKNIHIDGGATIPIKKYPNSSLQVGPDFQTDGTLLTLTVSAPDFLGNQGQGLDPQKLPDGRPLPSVAQGQLPAIALQVPKLNNAVFYVGPTVIGFFVPFSLDLGGGIVTFRFYNNENKPVGTLSLVGAAAGSNQKSGLLALLSADLMGIIHKKAGSSLKLK